MTLMLKKNYYSIAQRGEKSDLMESGGPGGEVMANPTNADILHLDAAEADRLAGALMNDYSRELVMVNKIHINIQIY